MKKSTFMEKLLEALEFGDIELTEDSNLQEIDEFDSLAIMEIIAFVHSHFDIKFSDDELGEITTVKSLMELIGMDKFE